MVQIFNNSNNNMQARGETALVVDSQHHHHNQQQRIKQQPLQQHNPFSVSFMIGDILKPQADNNNKAATDLDSNNRNNRSNNDMLMRVTLVMKERE